MAREAKDYITLHCKLARSSAEVLQDISDSTGIPKTAIVEKAILEYAKKHQGAIKSLGK